MGKLQNIDMCWLFLALLAKSYDRDELRQEPVCKQGGKEYISVKKGSLCQVSKIISLRVL